MPHSIPPETLRDVSIFQSIESESRIAIEHRCDWQRFSQNEQIVRHEDRTSDVFFVVRGTVRALVYSTTGKLVLYRDIGPGELFGEFSAIDNEPRVATVEAAEISVVARMTSEILWEVLQTESTVAAAMLRRLTSRIRALDQRVFEFSTLAARNRIHAELLRLARSARACEDWADLSPAPTHADIASRISSHREAVSRELSRLAKRGLIKRIPNGMRICNLKRLEQMVQIVEDQP